MFTLSVTFRFSRPSNNSKLGILKTAHIKLIFYFSGFRCLVDDKNICDLTKNIWNKIIFWEYASLKRTSLRKNSFFLNEFIKF